MAVLTIAFRKVSVMTRPARYLAIVLLLCFAMRFAFFLLVQPWRAEVETNVVLQSDALGYHYLARSLITTHRFAYSTSDGSDVLGTPLYPLFMRFAYSDLSAPDALRTPLYPLFIATIYTLGGPRPWLVLLVQALLDTLSCWLLFKALYRPLNVRAAWGAALFYAIDPFLILGCATLMSEILFVFLLILAFYWVSVALQTSSARTSLRSYVLASLCLGGATLVRPIAQYILGVLILFVIMRERRMLWPKVALSALAFGLVLLPWMTRNAIVFGRPALSNSGSYNLLILDVLPMEMAERHQDEAALQKALLAEAEQLMRADGWSPQQLNQFQRADYWQRLALQYIRAKPLRFVTAYLRGMGHTFIGLGTSGYTVALRLPTVRVDPRAYPRLLDLLRAFFAQKGGVGLLIAAAILAYLIVSYLATGMGAIVSIVQRGRPILGFALLMALYFLVVTGATGTVRFKLPVIPFYLPFAGVGIDYLCARWQRRNKGNER
jgi:4-amino-4-deoxy-L-arabinose transferase-like glycosyltransferase